jgi:hypothetical protein
MSRPGDRITIPTNGHHTLDVEASPVGSPPTSPPSPETDPSLGATRPDLRFAVTPGQAIMGFGIIASLILLVLERRRRRHDR